jgi:signal transduction histidine kinase
MVESFLLLTRVRHGKAVIPNQELCTIRDIIVASYEGCASMASQHKVRVGVILPDGDDVDAAVLGNADLLRTVIDNLLRNAIRFSPVGSMVEIIGRVEGQHLFISVRDFGPGIPIDLLPRIFDRFSQSNEEQRRGRGHGLGLEIAMGITELHGGTISVRNLDTGGCEFEVVLPISHDGSARPIMPPSGSVSRPAEPLQKG